MRGLKLQQLSHSLSLSRHLLEASSRRSGGEESLIEFESTSGAKEWASWDCPSYWVLVLSCYFNMGLNPLT